MAMTKEELNKLKHIYDDLHDDYSPVAIWEFKRKEFNNTIDNCFLELFTLAQQALSMQETLNIEDEPSDKNYPHRRRSSLAGDAIKASQQSIDQQGGEWKTGNPEKANVLYWVEINGIEIWPLRFNGKHYEYQHGTWILPFSIGRYYSIPITIPPMPNRES